MSKVKLLCPEVKRGEQVIQKKYEKEFDMKVAEKILKKGRWQLPDNSPYKFDGTSLIAAKKKATPKPEKVEENK